jgi:hypothetical protein
MPVSPRVKLAARLKMAELSCSATTRRVVKLRPSRMRSTVSEIGTPGRPGRRK